MPRMMKTAHRREFLNEKCGMAACEWHVQEDGTASLTLSDCGRTVHLEFYAHGPTRAAMKPVLRKLDKLIGLLVEMRGAMAERAKARPVRDPWKVQFKVDQLGLKVVQETVQPADPAVQSTP